MSSYVSRPLRLPFVFLWTWVPLPHEKQKDFFFTIVKPDFVYETLLHT